jgi:tetratricopeptide (TPR) repeat protein
MKTQLFAVAAIAVLAGAPAGSKTTSYNRELTNACYQWADLRIGQAGAISDCSQALAREAVTTSDRVATLVNRGIVLMSADDPQRALRDFDEALSLDSSQGEAWLGKALLSWQSGNSQEAKALADRALRSGVRRPALAFFVRGISNEKLGDVKSAYRDLLHARRLEPKWSWPREELQRYHVASR